MSDNQADGFKEPEYLAPDEDPFQRALAEASRICPCCGSIDCRRWKLLSGQDVCSECWSDFQDVPSALRPVRVTTRAGSASVPVVTPLRLKRRKSPLMPRLSPAQQPKRRLNAPEPAYNSVCRQCSHIWYDATLSQCPRCGGLIQLRTNHDLGLMMRHPHAYVESNHEGD